jgi:hypothetical protein
MQWARRVGSQVLAFSSRGYSLDDKCAAKKFEGTVLTLENAEPHFLEKR